MTDMKSKTVPGGLMGTGAKATGEAGTEYEFGNELGALTTPAAGGSQARRVGTNPQRTTVGLRGEYNRP